MKTNTNFVCNSVHKSSRHESRLKTITTKLAIRRANEGLTGTADDTADQTVIIQ
ncbi:unnamed protein product, partial [Medioppia subpectinata]